MFPPMEMEGASYYLKPMNCPFHILGFFRSRGRLTGNCRCGCSSSAPCTGT